eukprot:ctg_29.g11
MSAAHRLRDRLLLRTARRGRWHHRGARVAPAAGIGAAGRPGHGSGGHVGTGHHWRLDALAARPRARGGAAGATVGRHLRLVDGRARRPETIPTGVGAAVCGVVCAHGRAHRLGQHPERELGRERDFRVVRKETLQLSL